MVENLEELKKAVQGSKPEQKCASSLLYFYGSLVAFDRKLEKYTLAKCAYERNMETCVLEYLYFSVKSRSIV